MADGVQGIEGGSDVFISYSHQDDTDLGHATELARRLQDAGFNVWWDRDLVAGDDWDRVITAAMGGARRIIALISKRALASIHCRYEIRYARGHDKLVPVAIEAISPGDFDNELSQVEALHRIDVHIDDAFGQIVKAIGISPSRAPKAIAAPAPSAADISLVPTLTQGAGFLVGREREETMLLDAWASCAPGADPKAKTNVLVLHAIGGAGKTALLRLLVDRLSAEGFPHARRVIGWSAYSQGAGDNRNADADTFISEALRFMGHQGDLPTDGVERGRRLAAALQKEQTLLLLDGIEPLQSLPSENGGRLKDRGLQRLIQDLAFLNPGLVVITSRQPLPELASQPAPRVRTHALEQLDAKAGAHLLRHLRCWGKASELEAAVAEAEGHALTISLLGGFIAAVEGGDIARRDHFKLADIAYTAEELAADDQTVRLARKAGAILKGFIARFEALAKEGSGKGDIERMLLNIVGLFDRPADGPAVRMLLEGEPIPGLTDAYHALEPHLRERTLRVAKSRLRELRLLVAADGDDPDTIDAHPVVRAHFGKALKTAAPEAHHAAHEQLYRHYREAAPDLPETLAEMQPLFYAIGHACAAGLHQDAFNEIYWRRIGHGNSAFINRQLGAHAADLGALAHFFACPWSQPATQLDESSRGSALNFAAYALRALGRLQEAEAPLAAGLALATELEDWENASVSAGTLSELRLIIGNILAGVEAAKQACVFADLSGSAFQVLARTSNHAHALHQAGRAIEALPRFTEAKAIQEKNQPSTPHLYSMRGYQHCELLLDLGWATAVRERIAWSLPLARHHRFLLDIGLDSLSDACAQASIAAFDERVSTSAVGSCFDAAVAALREAGKDDYIPRGLLARAAFRRQVFERICDPIHLQSTLIDLAEVEEIASRGGMKLYLTDYCLESARLCLAQIPGAPREELIPLDPPPERPAPPPPAPRTGALTAAEKHFLDAAEEHFSQAYDLVQSTGYHRRDRELADLRRRIDYLRGLG